MLSRRISMNMDASGNRCVGMVIAITALGLVGAIFISSCQTEGPSSATTALKGEGEEFDVIEAVQRPIEEFVAAQGTFCWPDGMGGCFVFVPPVENFIGSGDPEKGICASVDYAGLADQWITAASGGAISLGTTTSGSVTERPLADGRAEVHVRLDTENALTWVVSDCDFANGPLLFGYRAPDVLAGADPALGSSFVEVKFINAEPGAPLPDLMQLFFFPEPGQELIMMGFRQEAAGPLRAAYGVPDGTPGYMTDIQTGLLMTGFHGAVGDAFPAERINLHVLGGSPGEGELH